MRYSGNRSNIINNNWSSFNFDQNNNDSFFKLINLIEIFNLINLLLIFVYRQ